MGAIVAKEEWLNLQVDKFESKLLGYVRRFVTMEIAQEIVQDAFLRLWEEGPAKVEGRELQWLYCVCRNMAFNINKKALKGSRNAFELTERRPNDSIELKLVKLEQIDSVYKIIGSLSPQAQEVIRFRFVDGFAYKEIAEITGHSLSYVGVLIHEAIAKVRHGMEEEESQPIKVGNETVE